MDRGNNKDQLKKEENLSANSSKKICHKFPPMMVQRQNIAGKIETTVNPLYCFGEICSYWCNEDNMCIDACLHIMEHLFPEEAGDDDVKI